MYRWKGKERRGRVPPQRGVDSWQAPSLLIITYSVLGKMKEGRWA
jgi:hypothetical protein